MNNLKKFSEQEILKLPKRYRANFINSLSGFKSANLIGTKSIKGQLNCCIVSSCVHLGSDPALLGFISRPPVVERHTYENIKETRLFTINHVTSEMYQKAHQTSARYQQNESEFEQVGLSYELLDNFWAPYVEASPLKIGCELVKLVPIEANGTVLIIGKVKELYLLEDVIQLDGYVDIEALKICAVSGLDSYHLTKRLSRLAYAKPNQLVKKMLLSGDSC